MANSVNKVTLIGFLGKDPERKSTQSGDSLVTFSLATSETWKDRGTGERRDKTEWHSISVFNEHHARFAEAHLRKGAKVYLEGQIQTRSWKDKDGADRKAFDIVIPKFKGELMSLSPSEQNSNNGYGEKQDDYVPF